MLISRYFSQPDLDKRGGSPDAKLLANARSQGNIQMTQLEADFAKIDVSGAIVGKQGKKGGKLHGNPR